MIWLVAAADVATWEERMLRRSQVRRKTGIDSHGKRLHQRLQDDEGLPEFPLGAFEDVGQDALRSLHEAMPTP